MSAALTAGGSALLGTNAVSSVTDDVPFATSAAGEQAWNETALATTIARPTFRIWHWPKPAIVLGRSQQALVEQVAERAGPDVEVLARGSGGGAVLCGPWLLGASVALPTAHPLLGSARLVDAYRWLGEAHLRALQAIGVGDLRMLGPALHGQASPVKAVSWACFGSLSPGELVDARERKLLGLAQQRRRHGVLLVSGLLVRRPPWHILGQALGREEDVVHLEGLTCAVEDLSDADTAGLSAALDREIGQALRGEGAVSTHAQTLVELEPGPSSPQVAPRYA